MWPPWPGPWPMAEERVDIVVIGAGIHGAGIAQAAAAAGYSVRLLEQAPAPAQGTSSRSSKLIHGGLRYLEGLQLGLVHECLRERRRLLRLAPGLVRLRPFHIPVYRDTRRRPGRIALGLGLYALLAGLGPEARYARLPPERWAGLDGLRTDGLQAVFRYLDGQTDDAALTRAVLASARALGARADFGVEVTALELEPAGVRVQARGAGGELALRARCVVNATGPWLTRLLQRVTPRQRAPELELVAGSHVLLPGRLEQGMYYVEAPRDGRAVFVMPREDGVLVGTTERPYAGDPAEVDPTPGEIEYLLETYAHYFPAADTALRGAYAGLRVLPGGRGRAFHRPRDTRLITDREPRPRLLSIAGGKLTAYRATAERVMARLRPSLPPRAERADTRTLPLPPP